MSEGQLQVPGPVPPGVSPPDSVKRALEVVRDWALNGVCPQVRDTKLACAWTCPDCRNVLPATIGSDPDRRSEIRTHVYPEAPNGVRCALVRPNQDTRSY